MDIEALKKEVGELRKIVDQQGIRLAMAQAWIDFLHWAYDMLAGYEINYKTLKEYKEDRGLDEAMKLPISAAQIKIIEYLGRLRSAIKAAIRRKNFKVH